MIVFISAAATERLMVAIATKNLPAGFSACVGYDGELFLAEEQMRHATYSAGDLECSSLAAAEIHPVELKILKEPQ